MSSLELHPVPPQQATPERGISRSAFCTLRQNKAQLQTKLTLLFRGIRLYPSGTHTPQNEVILDCLLRENARYQRTLISFLL